MKCHFFCFLIATAAATRGRDEQSGLQQDDSVKDSSAGTNLRRNLGMWTLCESQRTYCLGEREDCSLIVGTDDYECVCKAGWKDVNGDRCMSDLNECEELDVNPCPSPGGICVNRFPHQGMYSCGCDDGFTASDETNEHGPVDCITDNCNIDASICVGDTVCENGVCEVSRTILCAPCPERNAVCGDDGCECTENMSFDTNNICQCDEGFVVNPNDSTMCNPSNTIVLLSTCNNDDCPENQECPEDGGLGCVCITGYRRTSPTLACHDIDECAENACPNNPNLFCVNRPGDYWCRCPGGYSLVNNYCIDIDECLNSPCGDSATCQNTDGSYVCDAAPVPATLPPGTTAAPSVAIGRSAPDELEWKPSMSDYHTVKENGKLAFVASVIVTTDPNPVFGFIYNNRQLDQDLFIVESDNEEKVNGNYIWKSTPDYENPDGFLANNTYRLIITATNLHGRISRNVFIQVTDAQEGGKAPPVFHGTFTESVYENQLNAYQADVTDADGDQIIYSISDSDTFTINDLTGKVEFKEAPDYETQNSYTFSVFATDQLNTVEQEITINILDVNEGPVFSSKQIGYFPEDTLETDWTPREIDDPEGDGWTCASQIGQDSEYFNVDPTTCTVSPINPFDFEIPFSNPFTNRTGNTYDLTLVATDSRGVETNFPIQIIVQNVDEDPQFLIPVDDVKISENFTVGDTIYNIWEENTPVVEGNGTVTWTIEDEASLFAIAALDYIANITLNQVLDYEVPVDDDADNIYNITIFMEDDQSRKANFTLRIEVSNETDVQNDPQTSTDPPTDPPTASPILMP